VFSKYKSHKFSRLAVSAQIIKSNFQIHFENAIHSWVISQFVELITIFSLSHSVLYFNLSTCAQFNFNEIVKSFVEFLEICTFFVKGKNSNESGISSVEIILTSFPKFSKNVQSVRIDESQSISIF
jgi:hypothetical protein